MISANLTDALIMSVGWVVATVTVIAILNAGIRRGKVEAHRLALYTGRHNPLTCEWCDLNSRDTARLGR